MQNVKKVVGALILVAAIIMNLNDVVSAKNIGGKFAIESQSAKVQWLMENEENVEVMNNNIPAFIVDNDIILPENKKPTDEFEIYSDLDNLGRCSIAFANISKQTMPTESEKRGPIGKIKPTGWHTAKYPEAIKDKYLYNRCHLIAYCLAGENANEKNLITGTRYLNTELMLPFEILVAEYMDVNPDNHVLYRVTPVFSGDNLLASAVTIEAYSVEDNGEGICFNVQLRNVQPGILINYATGKSWLAKNYEDVVQ